MNFDIIDSIARLTLLGSVWVLWLLIILSGVSLTIIINRIVYLRKISLTNFRGFNARLADCLYRGDVRKSLDYCDEFRSFESRVAKVALTNWDMGSDAIKHATDSVMTIEKQKMEQGLVVLGSMGSNVPFIGLFGTVLGIIKAFHDLSMDSAGSSTVVMAGISEALVATAIGLVVAIPAIVAFNFFQRAIKNRMSNAEALQQMILACLAASERKKASYNKVS